MTWRRGKQGRHDVHDGTLWTHLPVSVHVLALLLAFPAVVVHFPILCNGLFPVPRAWLTGLPGIVGLDLALILEIGLCWGVLTRRRWASGAALAYVLVLGSSLVSSLVASSHAHLLHLAGFPARELGILSGKPIQGHHLPELSGLPIVGSLGVVIAAWRDLGAPGQSETAHRAG